MTLYSDKMNNKKRGISPVIATVLLIAMIIVIGLIIFLWFRGMVKEKVTKFEKNIELVCNDVQFDKSYSSGNIYISNIGNVPIYSMKVKIFSAGSHETKDIKDILTPQSDVWPDEGLNQGKTFSGATTGIADKEKIILIPVLVGQSEEGQRTFVCDDELYGKEITIS